MDVGGDPDAERLFDRLRVRDDLQQLVHEVESEVAVLQQGPAAARHELRHEAACVHLLALPHRDGATLDALPLGEVLDAAGRVGSHREEADEGRATVAPRVELVEVEDHCLRVLLAHRHPDVDTRLRGDAVRTP